MQTKRQSTRSPPRSAIELCCARTSPPRLCTRLFPCHQVGASTDSSCGWRVDARRRAVEARTGDRASHKVIQPFTVAQGKAHRKEQYLSDRVAVRRVEQAYLTWSRPRLLSCKGFFPARRGHDEAICSHRPQRRTRRRTDGPRCPAVGPSKQVTSRRRGARRVIPCPEPLPGDTLTGSLPSCVGRPTRRFRCIPPGVNSARRSGEPGVEHLRDRYQPFETIARGPPT